MTRRFAARTFYPHTCCFGCAICRWFFLGECKGRSPVSDKTAIGEWRNFTGEWRRKIELWKASDVKLGAAVSGFDEPNTAPASLAENEVRLPPRQLTSYQTDRARAYDAAHDQAGIATRGTT
jgi:hypothetical protein